ncbi:MAG: cadherin-like beta sandwich domain-containing protein [Fibrobacteria bacterium]|nr:cadherin-like beta sandwich domain-containing protein [Fibrobacteria bacterium]
MKISLKFSIGLTCLLFFGCLVDISDKKTSENNTTKNSSIGSLKGKVVDAAQKPIIGAVVTAQSTEGQFVTMSQTAGTYTFQNIPAGNYTITFLRYGYSETSSIQTTVSPDSTTESQSGLMKSEFITIQGKITIAGDLLKTSISSNLDNIGITIPGQNNNTQTDSMGVFTLTQVLPKNLTILAAKTGLGWGQLSPVLPSDIDTLQITLILDQQGSSARGSLKDAEGNPMTEVLVTAIGGGVHNITDSTGYFRLTNLPHNIPFTISSMGHINLSGLVVDENCQLDGLELRSGNMTIRESISFMNGKYYAPESGTIMLQATIHTQEKGLAEVASLFIWDTNNDKNYDTVTTVPFLSLDVSKDLMVNYGIITSLGDSLHGASLSITRVSNSPKISLSRDTAITVLPQDQINFPGKAVCLRGGISMYQWDLNGDGIIDYESKENGNILYRYTEKGTYNTLFRIHSSSGLSDSSFVTIQVKGTAVLLPAETIPPTQLINPVNGEAVGENVLLNWTNVSANNYSVFLDTVSPPKQVIASNYAHTFLQVTNLTPGTPYFIKILAHKGSLTSESFCTKIIAGAYTNQAPRFTQTSQEMMVTVIEKKYYHDSVTAEDPDGDEVHIAIIDNIPGMELQNGIITWAPGSSDVGIHRVRLLADDLNGGKDTLSWYIRVINSSDATLSFLGISAGTLSPSFSSSTESYTVYVSNDQSTLLFNPITAHPEATLFLNDKIITSGDSVTCNLDVGNNTVNLDVTAASGTDKKQYVISVIRLASDNVVLAGLQLSSGQLSPGFQPDSSSYTAAVSYETDSVTMTTTAGHKDASITINGTTVHSTITSPRFPLQVGLNDFIIKVTSQSQTTTSTYHITINRAGASDASLADIAITPGTLSPNFTPSIQSYSATFEFSDSSLIIIPRATHPQTLISIGDEIVDSESPTFPIPLTLGENVLTIVATSEDSVSQMTYYLIITRKSNASVSLSDLSTSTGTLTPAFSSFDTSYTVTVANNDSSISLTPVATDTNMRITIHGDTVLSGSPSQNIPLASGDNTVIITVSSKDGAAVKTYRVTIHRLSNASASLSQLSLSNGILSPLFNPSDTLYMAAVQYNISSITFTAVTTHENATITINGTSVAPGTTSDPISLSTGYNIINIIITAEDGISTRKYTISVNRPALTSKLQSLVSSSGTLHPDFLPDSLSYTDTISNSVSALTLTPTAESPNAVITINGDTTASGTTSSPINLSTGNNQITLVVIAEDGINQRTYILSIYRHLNTNAYLSALTSSEGTLTPVFNKNVTSYTDTVSNNITSLTVTPVTEYTEGMVSVNEDTVISGQASPTISLNSGNNTVSILVTAQDGITQKTYTVTIYRTPSDEASLSDLLVSKGTLSPVFSSGVYNYTVSLPWTDSVVSVTPNTTHPQAIIIINEDTVVSGTLSDPITLPVLGENTITVVIIAEDSETVLNYSIILTRTNESPIVSSIPNSTIDFRTDFSSLSLDNYVSDPDHMDNLITWTVDTVLSDSGDDCLIALIDNTTRIATISKPSTNWYGQDTIVFRATDPFGETDTTRVIYAVAGWKTYMNKMSGSIQSMVFPSNYGYAVFSSLETVIRSTDFGKSWEKIHENNSGGGLNEVYFHDYRTGWTVGNGGKILRTTNATLWYTPTSGASIYSNLYGVHFSDHYTGWAVGVKTFLTIDGTKQCIIVKTEDGGVNWEDKSPSSIGILRTVISLSATVAVAAGDSGYIIRTTNGGTSWSKALNAGSPVNCLYRANSGVLWAGADDDKLYFSTNSGLSWESISLSKLNPGDIKAIHFVNGSVGWAYSQGSTPTIYKTTDGGTAWKIIQNNNDVSASVSTIAGFGEHEAIISNGSSTVLRYGPKP